MEYRIILVPHYKESFKTLLTLALYMRDNGLGCPHFVIYFDDKEQVTQTLENLGIDFSIYQAGVFTKIPLIGKAIKIVADLIYAVRLVERLSPVQGMVCAVETNELEYALIPVLNRRNINTMVLQWAQTAPSEYHEHNRKTRRKGRPLTVVTELLKRWARRLFERLFGVKYSRSYGDGAAKHFAVMGKYYEELFSRQGVSKHKLTVTGHPEHDRLYELSQNIADLNTKRAILESLNLDHTRPVWILAREAIVYFEVVPEEKDKEDVCAVLEILSKYRLNVQIILKMHPRDHNNYYDFVRQRFPHVIIIHECDLYSLIAACDLYICQISSTMMWALALDKPVISYDFNRQPYWHYLREREGVINVNSPADLAKEVDTIAKHGSSSENHRNCDIAKKKYMMLDGRACERIAELITEGNRSHHNQ